MTQYRAFVEVITPDYKYWNYLSSWRDTESAALLDIEDYIKLKHSKGQIPSRTKVEIRS
jgi:hypothetical protein